MFSVTAALCSLDLLVLELVMGKAEFGNAVEHKEN